MKITQTDIDRFDKAAKYWLEVRGHVQRAINTVEDVPDAVAAEVNRYSQQSDLIKNLHAERERIDEEIKSYFALIKEGVHE